MLDRLFYLRPGELRRLLPFCGLYVFLFVALTLADGLSLALFVQRVGAHRLPLCYALTALMILPTIAGYLYAVERVGGRGMFQGILTGSGLVYFVTWLAISQFGADGTWYALLFVGREISYTLVLMHFGTYLQDYFTREQLSRVMPLIYAGGRLGGIAGGWVLQTFSAAVGPINLVLVFIVLQGVCLVVLYAIARGVSVCEPGPDDRAHAGLRAPDGRDADELEAQALSSVRGFLGFVWASPLMFWTTVTAVLYVGCRWVLNYQYSTYFEQHFADDVAMAVFLGKYTQIALLFSLLLQLFVVARMVAWIGLKGAHALYSTLLLAGFGWNLLPMTLPAAVFSRFLEAELRFGLRNPVAQLMINQFSKALRIRVRAWSLGFLIPCSTLATSLILRWLAVGHLTAGVAWLGGFVGLGYFLTSFGLYTSFSEKTETKNEEPVTEPLSHTESARSEA
jgi:ATP:ADP antiporter, AAA family